MVALREEWVEEGGFEEGKSMKSPCADRVKRDDEGEKDYGRRDEGVPGNVETLVLFYSAFFGLN